MTPKPRMKVAIQRGTTARQRPERNQMQSIASFQPHYEYNAEPAIDPFSPDFDHADALEPAALAELERAAALLQGELYGLARSQVLARPWGSALHEVLRERQMLLLDRLARVMEATARHRQH